MQLLLLILLPFACAVLAAAMPANARNREAWLAGGTAVVGLLLALSLFEPIAHGEGIRQEWT